MKSMMRRTTFREIKNTFGRFMAILAIIALGVGFFSGLKLTKPDMTATIIDFLDDMNFYDLHLLSTLGYTEDDVESFAGEDGVKYAEGTYAADVIYSGIGDSEHVMKTLSIPENVNSIQIVDGRMPESADECVVDSRLSDVQIGDTIVVSGENTDDTRELLISHELTVTGTVNSALYINFERGTTSLGNGKVAGFVYVLPEVFDSECYTDVYIVFDGEYELYSDEYDDFIDDKKEAWEDICAERVSARYHDVLVAQGVPQEMADEMSIDDADVSYYILGRDTNVGYVCFESDSEIVNGVARVFPVFFILVAVLVCMTTMSRMVEDQRTMIGVLKALGYGNAAIMGKYMIYSGTAAVIGCVSGYLIGTWIFPEVIWYAYQMMYISLPLVHVFDWQLAVLALAVALVCTIGTTWFTCRHTLRETAAGLMRPRAPKVGKRVFLERIPFIWKRLSFLRKVSARNIFRYKKRFFMMVIGISGCTALLLTGFGINDSIANFADDQYDDIQIYDGSITLKDAMTFEDKALSEVLADVTDSYALVSEMSWDLVTSDGVKSVNVIAMEEPEDIGDYMIFKSEDDEDIAYPADGYAVINNALADTYDLSVGDEITVRNSDMEEISVEISGIFVNHVYNYVYISLGTYEAQMGDAPEYNAVYFNLASGLDAHEASAELMDCSEVSSVTICDDLRDRVSQMMESLNYIVLVVILSAAALAFIVLYNLTNINITERIREIATVKVLGFFRNETSSYVFRENRVLTACGIVVGLVLGVFLHRFVMAQIHVDMVSFNVYIAPISYVYSIILTFVFNFCVNLIMSARLEKINMAESLKSVD